MQITIFGMHLELWEAMMLLFVIGGIIHCYRRLNRDYSGKCNRFRM